jgi:hypothetical protein
MKHYIKTLALASMALLCSCSKVFYTIKTPLNEFQNARNLTGGVLTENGEKLVSFIHINNENDPALVNMAAPLAKGFAHNDYIHKRPLFEALENGFTNVEADIFLNGDKLIVAHILPYFKGKRTLESLYLRPLSERIANNGGKVFAGYNSPVTLMIDIKTNADKTYKALKILLEKYKSILSGFENGRVTYRAVTIVLSGHKPYALLKNEISRLAFIDEDLLNITPDSTANNLFAMASCKYSHLVKWNGEGVFPAAEKTRLSLLVASAHKIGARVRLWASPEKREVWDELLKCGVDLINTDQLAILKNYLTASQTQRAADEEKLYSNLNRFFPPEFLIKEL